MDETVIVILLVLFVSVCVDSFRKRPPTGRIML